MPSPRLIDLPGNGNVVAIRATLSPVRRWWFRESLLTSAGVANTPQGVLYQIQDVESGGLMPSPTTFLEIPAPSTANEPGDFPKAMFPSEPDMSFHGPLGKTVGSGPQPTLGGSASLGTLLCNAKTAAGATTIEFYEIP